MITSGLEKIGVVCRSNIFMERVRDPNGKLTHWLTGRRFIWINVPKKPIMQMINIGHFKASLYYKEQKPASCRRCLREGHSAHQCTFEERCLNCGTSGHRKGDGKCKDSGDSRSKRHDVLVDDRNQRDHNDDERVENRAEETSRQMTAEELETGRRDGREDDEEERDEVESERSDSEEGQDEEEKQSQVQDLEEGEKEVPQNEEGKDETDYGTVGEKEVKSNGMEDGEKSKKEKSQSHAESMKKNAGKGKKEDCVEGREADRGRNKKKNGKEGVKNDMHTLPFFLEKARSASQKRSRPKSISPTQESAHIQRQKTAQNS
ncbi:hypothetical protein ElyMa_001387400 [Elysia marginata]|uniref:CCHC-type domain-containing protein n=1 Tax=Elysia marginata TaxID=1093978 RepID=A0AAV4IUK1_9GAST|nr:hypothetical protein ElyMa_001387400 [Elysia marginata]